jgi:uncharacterized membrane protein
MRKEFGRTLTLATGAGTGAVAVYFLDAHAGAGRRALVRDKAYHGFKRLGEAMVTVASDAAGKSHAVMPALKHRLFDETVDDGVLIERVRAKLGRYVSHPGSIQVDSERGAITLRGPILESERKGLLRRTARVPGVREVRDALEPHAAPGVTPGLQGEGGRKGERFELFQRTWSPATRFAAGSLGAGLAFAGLRRGGPAGWAFGLLGAGWCARALANMPLRGIFGLDRGAVSIRLQKTINLNAPISEVFALWSSYDNFPRFMPHVIEVKDLGRGLSRWRIKALPGLSTEWEAEITELVPYRTLAWRSLPGAAVPNEGVVRFQPNGKGGTTVDVKLAYHPPAGAIGHAFAALLGADPKKKLDRDLMIMKDFVERTPSHVGRTAGTAGTIGPSVG